MNDLGERLAAALRSKSQDGPRVGGLEEAARARYRHRRRRALVAGTAAAAATLMAVPVVAVLVSEPGGTSPPVAATGNASPPTPSTTPPDAKNDAEHSAATLTRCGDVPRNEPPQDHGADTSFDPGTGFIDIWYTVGGENRHHTIDYLNDDTCAEHPLLRRLISDVVDTATENYPDAPPLPPPWSTQPTGSQRP